jgi:molecular chaperone GrpE
MAKPIPPQEPHEDEVSESELQRLAEESAANLNGWKRALADYDNLKQETEKRQGETRWFLKANLISDFLPFFDHFKLALDHIPEAQKKENWVVGLGHIRNQAEDLLKNWGVTEIPVSQGDKAQHELHEAVDSVAETDKPDNTIIRVVSPGYYLDQQVVRPTKVIVNDLSKDSTQT